MTDKADLLKREGFYHDPLIAFVNTYPVPADCPAFLRARGKKDRDLWNTTAYVGDMKWCSRCIMFGRHCDGLTVRVNDDLIGKVG